MQHILRILLAVAALAAAPRYAHAVVTNEKRLIEYTCSGGTSYAYDFYVLRTQDLRVTDYTGTCGSATYSTLTLGSTFTATRTSTGGTVTVPGTCAAGHCLRIQRVVGLTQETAFRSQSTFYPAAHEAAFDKLTMEVQQLQDGIGQSQETAEAIENHIASSDDHTMYFKLAGRAGGQVAYGGTASGDDLLLSSTVNGVKGDVVLGTSATALANGNFSAGNDLLVTNDITVGNHVCADEFWSSCVGAADMALDTYGGTGSIWLASFAEFDQTTDRLCIDCAAPPEQTLQVTGNAIVTGTIYGGKAADSGADLDLSSTVHATKGKIKLGASSAYDEANTRLGLGTISPSSTLHVSGSALITGNLTAQGYALLGNDALKIADHGYIYGGLTASHALYLSSTENATKGYIYLGSAGTSSFNETTGDLSVTGDSTGMHPQEHNTTNQTAPDTIADCGRLFTTATNNLTYTLNDITAAYDGCELTFISRAANGTTNLAVAIHNTDYLVGICVGTAKTEAFDTSSNKGLQSLAASPSKMGDTLTLVADSTNNVWHIIGCLGNWTRIP